MTEEERLISDLIRAAHALVQYRNCENADVGTLAGGQRVFIGSPASVRYLLELHGQDVEG